MFKASNVTLRGWENLSQKSTLTSFTFPTVTASPLSYKLAALWVFLAGYFLGYHKKQQQQQQETKIKQSWSIIFQHSKPIAGSFSLKIWSIHLFPQGKKKQTASPDKPAWHCSFPQMLYVAHTHYFSPLLLISLLEETLKALIPSRCKKYATHSTSSLMF